MKKDPRKIFENLREDTRQKRAERIAHLRRLAALEDEERELLDDEVEKLKKVIKELKGVSNG